MMDSVCVCHFTTCTLPCIVVMPPKGALPLPPVGALGSRSCQNTPFSLSMLMMPSAKVSRLSALRTSRLRIWLAKRQESTGPSKSGTVNGRSVWSAIAERDSDQRIALDGTASSGGSLTGRLRPCAAWQEPTVPAMRRAPALTQAFLVDANQCIAGCGTPRIGSFRCRLSERAW
jgi:hypothetical protein